MPHLRGLRGGRAMGSVGVFKDDMLEEKMNMDGRSRMGQKVFECNGFLVTTDAIPEASILPFSTKF
jgi:hypothetical protein